MLPFLKRHNKGTRLFRVRRHSSGAVLRAVAVALAWLPVAVSCSDNSTAVTTDNGLLRVVATVDGRITMEDGTAVGVDERLLPKSGDLAMTLTSSAGNSHTWAALDAFDDRESFLAGAYTLRLEGQLPGENMPRLAAEMPVTITGGATTTATIPVTVTDAMLRVSGKSAEGGPVSMTDVTVHADGDGYYSVSADGRTHDMFIAAGKQHYYATLLRASDSRELRLALPQTTTVAAAHGASVAVDYDGAKVSITTAAGSESLDVAADIFDAAAPEIACQGFENGAQISVSEGVTLASPLIMDATAGRTLKHLWLSIQRPADANVSFPSELDLLNLSPDEQQLVDFAGLKVTQTASGYTVDFSRVVETMASTLTTVSTFTLMAEDIAGVCSAPAVLSVESRTVNVSVESVTGAAIGVNSATARLRFSIPDVERDDVELYTLVGQGDDDGERAVECPVTGWENLGEGRVDVTFTVPDGHETVKLEVDYLNIRRATLRVERTAPPFRIKVDPYATAADIHIVSDNDSITAAVTRYATVTVNSVLAAVTSRDPQTGSIVVTGLTADSPYTIGVSVVGTSETAKLRTEKALGVPSGNFLDWRVETDDKGLACGGRYSATPVSIVNRQNYSDIHVEWPKTAWANNNAKTYYKGSRNANTWYMQPACKEENRGTDSQNQSIKAIRISSVGWDHDGEAIPDYIQQEGNVVPYSLNVPKVAHRSAGRMFLGSYEYDAASGREIFREGRDFASRPTSLNGYYKFIPDVTVVSDRGYVDIRLLSISGADTTLVAQGRYEFATAPDYRAFSVPLTYSHYGVHPNRLCIMFCSSTATGTQEYEDRHVPVTALPKLGIMHGSTLWVSQLTFSY